MTGVTGTDENRGTEIYALETVSFTARSSSGKRVEIKLEGTLDQTHSMAALSVDQDDRHVDLHRPAHFDPPSYVATLQVVAVQRSAMAIDGVVYTMTVLE